MAEARQLTCEEVREELGEVAEGLRRTSAPVRRHLRTCDRCTNFRKQLRADQQGARRRSCRSAPLLLFKKVLLAHLGTTAGAGARGAAGAAGGAAAGGAVSRGHQHRRVEGRGRPGRRGDRRRRRRRGQARAASPSRTRRPQAAIAAVAARADRRRGRPVAAARAGRRR